jgi:hypothetical protein
VKKVRADVQNELTGDEDDAVEMSSQRLGILLGIGRHAARTRLANAIEAGAVVDVRISTEKRPPTAPKSLRPNLTWSRDASPVRSHRGAFPTVTTVNKYLSDQMANPAGQAAKGV